METKIEPCLELCQTFACYLDKNSGTIWAVLGLPLALIALGIFFYLLNRE